MSDRLSGAVALVTGASRGLGQAAAVALAAEGAHIIAVARTAGGLEETDDAIRAVGGKTTLVPLDLADGDGIDRLGAAVFERWGRLDVLVGNAGRLGMMGPLSHVPPADWLATLEINLTANWRLIRSFEPLLKQADAGRAMFVTSGAAQNFRAYLGPYATSKAALEAMVLTWAAEMRDSPVRVNLLSPGSVRTRMRAQVAPGEDPNIRPTPDKIAPLFVELALPSCTRHGEIVAYES